MTFDPGFESKEQERLIREIWRSIKYTPQLLGERIRSKREQRDLKQRDLAEALGISVQSISFWESGRTEPAFDRLFDLAKILQEDPAWLLSGLRFTGLDHPWIKESAKLQTGNYKARPRKPVEHGFVRLLGRRVPRIEYVNLEVETILEGGLAAVAGASKEAVFSQSDVGENSVAVRVWETRNSPRFEQGDAVIVDPDIAWKPADWVLARRESELLIGRIKSIGDGAVDLLSENPDWMAIRIDKLLPAKPKMRAETSCILGVVVEHTRPIRRR